MSSRTRKSLLLALASVAALAFGGCGDSHTKVTTGTYAGESGANAPYLDVGPLVYQVQLSRQLNPSDTEDSSYLQGLNVLQRRLLPTQEWFGVFIQVYNHSSRVLQPAATMLITDTQGNIYAPVVPDRTNSFAYRAEAVAPDGRLPVLDSVPAQGATQGAVLLYKIKLESLENRPLKLTIFDPTGTPHKATVELDV